MFNVVQRINLTIVTWSGKTKFIIYFETLRHGGFKYSEYWNSHQWLKLQVPNFHMFTLALAFKSIHWLGGGKRGELKSLEITPAYEEVCGHLL